jgi:hypothetical protein
MIVRWYLKDTPMGSAQKASLLRKYLATCGVKCQNTHIVGGLGSLTFLLWYMLSYKRHGLTCSPQCSCKCVRDTWHATGIEAVALSDTRLVSSPCCSFNTDADISPGKVHDGRIQQSIWNPCGVRIPLVGVWCVPCSEGSGTDQTRWWCPVQT